MRFVAQAFCVKASFTVRVHRILSLSEAGVLNRRPWLACPEDGVGMWPRSIW